MAEPGLLERLGRRAGLAIALGLLLRAAAALLAPISDDLRGWELVAESLRRGGNPYEETTRLNWPPLWMLWIGVADAVAMHTPLPFAAALRVLPFAADAAIVFLLLRLAPGAGLLYAVHPAALTTTGAQAQFDALPALCVLVAVILSRQGGAQRALVVGLVLGLGAGFKTWPLLLAPALAWSFPRWSQRLRLGLAALLCWAFLLLPVAALSPGGLRGNVLGYASYPGWWGLTSLGIVLPSAPTLAVAGFAHQHGRLLLLLGLALVWARSARLPAWDAARATLLAFLALTPGFGPQYLLWLAPLACVARGPLPRAWHLTVGFALLAEFFLLPRFPADPALGPAAAALLGNQVINALRFPAWIATLGWLAFTLLPPRRPRPA